MELIDKFRERFGLNEFELSRHVLDQTVHRNITVAEIRQAVTRAEVIENYPNDKTVQAAVYWDLRQAADQSTFNGAILIAR